MHPRFVPAVAAIVLLIASAVSAQLRIVSLNSSNVSSTASGPRAGMDVILSAIGSSISDDPTIAGNTGISKPIDVLCLQEVRTAVTTGASYAALLNQIYNTNVYTYGTLDGGTTGAGTLARCCIRPLRISPI